MHAHTYTDTHTHRHTQARPHTQPMHFAHLQGDIVPGSPEGSATAEAGAPVPVVMVAGGAAPVSAHTPGHARVNTATTQLDGPCVR